MTPFKMLTKDHALLHEPRKNNDRKQVRNSVACYLKKKISY